MFGQHELNCHSLNILNQIEVHIAYRETDVRGMVKNLPLLRRAGNNGRPWVHTVMCDNTHSDICMVIHASTL